MKALMKTLNVKCIATSFVALALVACGGTGSPTKEYSDLGPVIRKTGQPKQTPAKEESPKTESNQVIFKRPEIVVVENGKEINPPVTFVEGQNREYIVKSQTFAKGVTYRLTVEGLPKGVSFKEIEGRPGTYSLSWTPEVGTLSRTETLRNYQFNFTYRITNPDKASLPKIVQIADATTQDYPYHATLIHGDGSPEIKSITLASDEIFVGDRNQITIAVVDPTATANDVPEIIVENEAGGSAEKQIVKLGRMIDLQEVAFKNGQFEYKLMLDTQPVLSLKDLKAENEGRFVVRVASVVSHKFTAATKSLKLMKKTEPVAVASEDKDAKKDDEEKPRPEPKAKKSSQKKTQKTTQKKAPAQKTAPAAKPQSKEEPKKPTPSDPNPQPQPPAKPTPTPTPAPEANGEASGDSTESDLSRLFEQAVKGVSR